MTTPRPDLARWVWRDFLRPDRALIFAAIILMAIEGSMLGVLSYLLRPMFDRVFVAGDLSALWWVGGAILTLFIVRGISGVFHKVILTRAMEKSAGRIQHRLLGHVMTLDAAFHQSHPPGYLIERVQGDVTTIKQSGGAILTGLGRDVISLISLFAVALWVDPVWTMIAIVGVPLLVTPSIMAQRFTRERSREAREIAGAMSTRLDEVFHGINPIKLNALEAYQSRRYRSLLDRRIKTETQASMGRALIPGLIDIMTGIGFLGVLYFGGREIIAGEKTIGEFMSFFTAMALMFEPLRRLGAINGLWQTVAASLERLRAIYDERPTVTSPAAPTRRPDEVGDIVLDDVHLSYGTLPVLNGTTFTAKAGETTALVGASGAGKSTVFNVLTRLVLPDSGHVALGETTIDRMALDDLRGLFSVVTQDALLFDESIRENVLLGRTDVPDEELAAAIDAAYLTDVIAGMPRGLETAAGPRGSGLSGGQRQRVAIARAVLRDAPVLLLDEATSALDAQSEAAVQAALDRLAKGRTTLVIAHRLATVRSADKIVVMDKGRVVDQGRHDELLARGGIYADLYRLQFSEEDPARA